MEWKTTSKLESNIKMLYMNLCLIMFNAIQNIVMKIYSTISGLLELKY